jgi:hypothetical protein
MVENSFVNNPRYFVGNTLMIIGLSGLVYNLYKILSNHYYCCPGIVCPGCSSIPLLSSQGPADKGKRME